MADGPTNESAPPDGTVTLMFTDIVGSTTIRDAFVRTSGEINGDAEYRRLVLEPHNSRVRDELAKYRGFEVSTAGARAIDLITERLTRQVTKRRLKWTQRSSASS